MEFATHKATEVIVVVGSENSSYQVQGARLPKPGETVRGDPFVVALGGKGANQARLSQ